MKMAKMFMSGTVRTSENTSQMLLVQETLRIEFEPSMTTTIMMSGAILCTASTHTMNITGRTMATLTGSSSPTTKNTVTDGTSGCSTNILSFFPQNIVMAGMPKFKKPHVELTGVMVSTSGILKKLKGYLAQMMKIYTASELVGMVCGFLIMLEWEMPGTLRASNPENIGLLLLLF